MRTTHAVIVSAVACGGVTQTSPGGALTVMPLVNLDHLNDGLNGVEDLERSEP